ncbi:serine/threonine-protein phosphatase 4 regulatory subunit 3-B-like [Orycteropus afer afer]|uniref:Serine/threonine-protein phosphatase 4 regulatory subunit 3-B-like n=1 Tax=Orycteropus afer afer TaxID=1230840 RepID=A0A8B7B4Y2_ORYAF|nr:serine/threonine-protein phosphatase 4 regulatory subunit 3-B-like [Orycteropus afer afer]
MALTQPGVKVYILNDEQQWDNLGTGFISCTYLERHHETSLLITSEVSHTLILMLKINRHTVYQKQKKPLIIWSEAENQSLALRFWDPDGCQAIWEEICRVQGKDPSDEMKQDLLNATPYTSTLVYLPDCELSTLEQIAGLVNLVFASPVWRDRLALILESEEYVKKLLQLFHTCERLENIKALHHLHEIITRILFLNKTSLFEVMFSDECIMDVVGCLEYDPTLAQPERHRNFLTQNAKFREVIPITDTELKQKIHQTHKVQYIRDILLPVPSMVDENVLSKLHTFLFFNKIEIVSILQEDYRFLYEVFTQLIAASTATDKRLGLLHFLKEVCEFSQILQPEHKGVLFQTLTHWGIFPSLKIVMVIDDLPIKSAAIDIVAFLVHHSPSIIWSYIMEEFQHCESDKFFLNVIIEQMICDTDPELGGAIQFMGVLRSLLDPNNMLAAPNECEKDEFLNFFYKHCMCVLVEPILETTAEDKCEKDNIVESNKNSPNNLGALRFMRRIVGLQDEFYNCYIIKGNLFEPVIKAFLDNGSRYNILSSAIIELFECVRVNNIKSLVAHIVEKFYKALESIEYVQTFKGLKIRYDEEKERQSKIQNLRSMQHTKVLCEGAEAFWEMEEMSFKEDKEDGEVLMPPLETSEPEDHFPSCSDEAVKVKQAEVQEDKADLSRRTPGGFTFASSHSAGVASSPSSSRGADVVDDPAVEDDDKEDGPPPRTRPCLSWETFNM